jgi:PAS domain S-box-containing protein
LKTSHAGPPSAKAPPAGGRDAGIDDSLFRRVCELAEEGVWVVDAQTRTTFANHKLAQMLGWQLADMAGRPLAEFVAPEEHAALAASVERRQQGIAEEFEFPLLRSNGQPLWVRVSTHPIFDDSGAYAGASAILSDITARRQAEAELKAAHTLLQATIDGISAHLCVLDDTGTIVAVNQAWRRFGAINGGNAVRNSEGTNYLDVCDRAAQGQGEWAAAAADAAAFATGLRGVIARRATSFELEYPCHTANEKRWFVARARWLGTDNPMRLLVEHDDISGPRRAELALRESEEHYRMLFDNSLDGVLITRPDGAVLAANPAACEMLRLPAAEICRRGRAGLTVTGDPRLKAWLRKRARSGTARGDLTLRRGDGSRFEAELSSSVYLDAAGGEHACIVIRDNSERLAAEQARHRLEARLLEAQKLESIGTLAGGIAHDFNNILASIMGNVALVQAELPTTHAAQDGLSKITRASHRARDLVQQILAFSRNQPLRHTAQPLAPMLDEVVALLLATLPAGVRLTLQQADVSMTVSADAGQIQQVLMNLGINAWHALRDGRGHIVIEAMPCRIGTPRDGAGPGLPPGRYAQISVRDDGIGMTDAVRQRIFEPFFSTKPVGQGTGLGLSVVHGIVLGHQGAISVDSRVGAGTQVQIWLPLLDVPALAAPAARPEAPVAAALLNPLSGRGEQVLFVDDDELMRLMVEPLLERLGYQARCCASADEALALVRAGPADIDLVLTDFNMPQRSGLDLARDLASLRPAMPVLICSGYIDDELNLQAGQAGVRRVLAKEHLLEELPSTLRKVLEPVAGNAPTGG